MPEMDDTTIPPAPVDESEIESILNDTTMPIEERVERLHALSAALGAREELDRDGAFDPLAEQINEALGMLAEGGHSYGVPDAAEEDDPPVGTPG